MSRRTKNESSQKLISIISTLLERQEKLYRHISDLEDYIDALESIGFNEESEMMDGGMIIEFVPEGNVDEKMKQVLDEGLTKEQKEKIEEIKKKKMEQNMHSMDDILKVFEDKGDNKESE